MPAPTNTLLIEGTQEELVLELAQFIDGLRKDGSPIQPDIQSAIDDQGKWKDDSQKEDALKKLVGASSALNSAAEREIIAAYNLLIHIVRQEPKRNMYFKKVVDNIVEPMTGSPSNGTGLQLACLSTLFNTVEPADTVRFNILDQVIKVIKKSSSFESLKPYLHSLESWLEEWDVDEERERMLFLEIASAAHDAGESDLAYSYLVRALRTFSADDSASDDARKQSLRALRVALASPTHFDFQDLTSLDSIQALRKSDPIYFELLELFTSEQLDDFADFKESHDGWLEKEGLDVAALDRKMRLLTLASLAASTQSRSLPYAQIASALQIPPSDVEMWVIDVIRAGLVEGKLSQLNQQFLIHRSTYRVFGENQWREVAARLDMWKTSLLGVLSVIRQQKEEFLVEKEREAREVDAKVNGATGGGGYSRRERGDRERGPRQVEVDAD